MMRDAAPGSAAARHAAAHRIMGNAIAFSIVAWAALAALPASAHSASDAYLTLTTAAGPAGGVVIHGQWDIALRDLDFVLKLDDGDGRLTWREVRSHRADIERYAYRYLTIGGSDSTCSIRPGRQMIDDHADGAYAALFFDAVCARKPRTLALHYTLFFTVDPSHRGIFVMHGGHAIATALLSPDNAKITLEP